MFKLHSPRNRVAGWGYYVKYWRLPVSYAWEVFGPRNGVSSLLEMRARVERYRRSRPSIYEDYEIGCIVLAAPVFLDEPDWLEVPGWHPNIQRGRRYQLDEEPGRSLWARASHLQEVRDLHNTSNRLVVRDAGLPRYGVPFFTRPRLGQGSFQVAVMDAYERRCSITGEKVVPALEAAHILPYAEGGEHRVDNGLLLRRDIHALFDRGYLTVTPQLEVIVSKRLRDQFHNGDEYLALSGAALRIPSNAQETPRADFLEWHNRHRFVA